MRSAFASVGLAKKKNRGSTIVVCVLLTVRAFDRKLHLALIEAESTKDHSKSAAAVNGVMIVTGHQLAIAVASVELHFGNATAALKDSGQ